MMRMVMKIKKGDTVMVLSGKDRGKQAKVIRVVPSAGTVILEGLFLTKKFIRPKRQGEKGQMVDVARPIFVSKVAIVCKHCGKSSRIGYRLDGKTKVRVCKKCQNSLV